MKPLRIRRWLRHLGTEPFGGARDRWVNAPCPLASKTHRRGRDENPSFGVRSDGAHGVAVCKCFACGFSGTQVSLVYRMRELKVAGADLGRAMRMLEAEDQKGGVALDVPDYDEAVASKAPRPLVAYPEGWRRRLEPAYAGREVHPYLVGRGVPARVARRFDVRWDGGEDRVVFPVRDWEGVLRGLHGRLVVRNLQRCRACERDARTRRRRCRRCGERLVPYPVYKMYRAAGGTNPRVWLGEHLVDPAAPVVVVESVFDACAVARHYPNVLAPLTASLGPEKVRRIDRCEDLVLLMDGDEAGRRACNYLQVGLPDSRVRVAALPDGADPADLAPNDLRGILRGFGLKARRST